MEQDEFGCVNLYRTTLVSVCAMALIVQHVLVANQIARATDSHAIFFNTHKESFVRKSAKK